MAGGVPKCPRSFRSCEEVEASNRRCCSAANSVSSIVFTPLQTLDFTRIQHLSLRYIDAQFFSMVLSLPRPRKSEQSGLRETGLLRSVSGQAKPVHLDPAVLGSLAWAVWLDRSPPRLGGGLRALGLWGGRGWPCLSFFRSFASEWFVCDWSAVGGRSQG